MSSNDIIYQSKGALIAFLEGEGFQTGSGGVEVRGSPSDNEIAVWRDPVGIEGDSNFTWDGSTLTVAGDAEFNEYLYHNGDADTYIRFAGDLVNVVAGGWSAIKLEKSTGKIQLNNGNQDLDVQAMADDGEVILHTDAATNSLGIGTTTPSKTLDVSGDVRATGDLTVSGSTTLGNASADSVTFDGTELTLGSAIDLDVGKDLQVRGNTTLGNASGDSVTINALTIDLANVAEGTDNTVLVYNGSSIVTDEIDSKVWAGDLVDYTGTPADNQLAIWTDTDTLEGDSGIIYNSGYFTVFPDSNVYATLGKTTDTNTEYARLNLKANANSTAVIGLLDARDSAVFGGMQLGTTSDHAIRVYQNNGYAMVIESDKSIGMAGNLGVSGSATLSGDLTVSGNDIKGSGGTAITMDGSNNVTLQNYVTIEEALRVNGDIIRNSTGTDVITFEGGCVSLPTGLSSSMGTSITGTDQSANAFEWVKVAEFITTGLNNYATAVIDVMLAGYDTTAEIYQARVHLRAKANTTSYSICQVDIIQDVGSEAWGTADFVLTQKTSTAYQGQLWVNSAASLQRCYATITNGSNDGQSNYKADWYLTPGQMWGSYASLGSDVTTINVKKRFDSLVIDGSPIGPDPALTVAGITTLTGQPLVSASRTSMQSFAGTTTSWQTIVFNDTSTAPNFDVGSDYSTGTGTFTAPADGKYYVKAAALLNNVPNDSTIILQADFTQRNSKNLYRNYYVGAEYTYTDGAGADLSYFTIRGDWIIPMDDGDTLIIQGYANQADTGTKFFGHATNWYTHLYIAKIA